MITLKAVSRTFSGRGGAVHALDSIDLDVERGEFVGVIGRSGCGKSTLPRVIAGLLPPSDGTVLVNGAKVHGTRRDVAMVFQRPALLPWRSVVANVLLPIEIAGKPVARHRRRRWSCWRRWGWSDSSSAGRTSCPAACSSGCRCAGR